MISIKNCNSTRLLICIYLIVSIVITKPVFAQQAERRVVLTGVVKNFSNIVEIDDKSEVGDILLPDPKKSFIPDSEGRFSISFSLEHPGYFKIGRNVLFLSPGDSLSVFIDYENNEIASFSGIHSAENNYLRFAPFPKAGSYLNGGLAVRKTMEETIAYVVDTANKRLAALKAEPSFSKEFIALETGRVTADILHSFYMLYSYFPRRNSIQGDSLIAFQNGFLEFIAPYTGKYLSKDFDGGLLQLEVYRHILGTLMNFTDTTGAGFAKIADWNRSMKMIYEMKSTADKSSIASFEKDIKQIKTPEYRNAVRSTFKALGGMNGKQAMNFVMTDSCGNQVQLSSFVNKVIFIDVWATWCGPCIKEQPYVDSLRKKFAANKDVIILSLSLDDELNVWKNFLKKNKLPGMQYMASFQKLEGYYVSEIPRTIVIGKGLKIAAMRGPNPSSSESVELINSLLAN